MAQVAELFRNPEQAPTDPESALVESEVLHPHHFGERAVECVADCDPALLECGDRVIRDGHHEHATWHAKNALDVVDERAGMLNLADLVEFVDGHNNAIAQ